MKIFLFLLCIFFALQSHAESYQKIHKDVIVVDTHNDILTKVVMYGFYIGKDLRRKSFACIES